MALPKVESQIRGKTIVLSVTMRRRRELSVVIIPDAANLVFEIWARVIGERLWHAWPGPHMPDDFFDPFEAAVIRAGLEELAELLVGKPLDADLMGMACGAVEMVLQTAAAPEEIAAPPA